MKFWPIKKIRKVGVGKKVFVGMSGGVDSSVSAALLQRQGYDVTGVFIKVWHPDFLPCHWEDERRDAMHVAAKLGIPFLTLDLEKEYKQDVVDYMVAEYSAGRTPNPDVMCNRYVKFGGFLNYALQNGADYVATGHYAQNIYDKQDGNGKYKMLAGKDENKDQSYFLWTLTQSQLKNILFPIGKYKKPHVRKLAKKFGLATASKKDSQGLCFIGKIDMKSFLQHFIESKNGDVVLQSGEVIGTHDGVLFYTIGQRHGFEINAKETSRKPHYVISKDIEKNLLVVSESPELANINPSEIELKDINWISGENTVSGTYSARFRYRQRLRQVNVEYRNGNTIIKFQEPQQGVSKGQSVVIYKNTECVGGGVIK